MKRFYYLSATATILMVLGCGDDVRNVTNITAPEDWRGPELAWQSPPDAEVRGTVGIGVAVTDSSEIAWVRLYVDGLSSIEAISEPYRFEVETDTLEDGVHVLEARAQDAHGNLGISPVLRINVMNSVAQGPRLIWVPDDYGQIQAAINAATDYDTIRVRPGTYYETLNLFGKGLWIESEQGPMTCRINSNGAHNSVFISSCSEIVCIRGFWIEGGNYNNIEIEDGAQIKFLNNIVMADTVYGLIHIGRSGGTILNNLFWGSDYPVIIWSLLGVFYNNIILDAGQVAMWNSNFGWNPVEFGYNLFWRNIADYYNFNPGQGDINADPLIDLESGLLLVGSPAIDSGHPDIIDLDSSRSDIGPFGGSWAYN